MTAKVILRTPAMRRWLALIVLCLWLGPAWAGELRQGVSAFRQGDYETAVLILKKLARQGDPYAQFSLGAMYDDGRGLPRNLKLALQWYKRAGAQGLADAQYMAGYFYGGGRGVRQDPAAALYWFELAAAGGHPLAGNLRDQHWSQLRAPVRERVEANATAWQAAHPTQLICKPGLCIHPAWTRRPRWNFFDPRQDFQ